MDRPSQFTNPTEINGGWVPSGDDAAGWIFSTPIVYDWKGRTRFTYNMDGTYKEASYGGFGCGGGEGVKVTGEVERQKKVYLGSFCRQREGGTFNYGGGGISKNQ